MSKSSIVCHGGKGWTRVFKLKIDETTGDRRVGNYSNMKPVILAAGLSRTSMGIDVVGREQAFRSNPMEADERACG